MPAQRNTEQPLVMEQQISKPEPCHPAESVSKPLIRFRPPTPPQLLNLAEFNGRDAPQKPSEPHRENGLRRLSPVYDPAKMLAVPVRPRSTKKEARPCSPVDELPQSGMPVISQKERASVPRKVGAKVEGAAASVGEVG